ncbi:MAG TPA: hypothetical protein VGR14_21795 [Verrucomicrobiae bacterium]|jgi:hypothetical protein|nr:hypothetical protein [Verrucomicrobiae bacterium]
MRLIKKPARIIFLGLLCLGLVVLAFCWPSQPKLIIPLADGSRLVLVGTDSGQQLYYGGGRWQRLLCKLVRHQLPAFLHGQPTMWPAFYTNGIALHFRREEQGGQAFRTAWNGTGRLYFLDASGMEHEVPNHEVNFEEKQPGQVQTVVAENMYLELPMLRDPELRLRIRETNDSKGSVSTHNFQIKNPAL